MPNDLVTKSSAPWGESPTRRHGRRACERGVLLPAVLVSFLWSIADHSSLWLFTPDRTHHIGSVAIVR